MHAFAVRYSLYVGITLFTFIQFVACGAQMYQVSLEQDTPRNSRSVALATANVASKYFGIHARAGWRELPIHFKVEAGLTETQRKGLTNAMATWEKAVGKKLFAFEGEDNSSGDSFEDLYSSLEDDINGNYLDNHWDKNGKSTQVLATTIWNNDPGRDDLIDTADIHFNSENYQIADSFLSAPDPGDAREVVDMESLALHELGHLLGLTHISADDDPLSIMNPALFIGEGLANRTMSESDVKRIQQVYGCTGRSCDIKATLAEIDKQMAAASALAPEPAQTEPR